MAQPQSQFLLFPRELRDQIYEDYLFTSDGYKYDYDAGKLRMADGRPIDSALMYACRRTAYEMRGLALRLNTVVFSTLYNDELRTRAARWDWVVRNIVTWQEPVMGALRYMGQESFENAMQVMGDGYFAACCRKLRPQALTVDPAFFSIDPNFLGEAPSVARKAESQFLRLALADPAAARYLNYLETAFWAHHIPGYMAHALDAAEREPWSIPTEGELDKYCRHIPNKDPLGDGPSPRDKAFWDSNRSKPRFSAAAAAIQFLSSSPESLRKQLRNIIVHEDRMSVNYPECHVMGLIPFCRENPSLRIERRVDLWRNCFVSARSYDFPLKPEQFLTCWEHHEDPNTSSISADHVVLPVAKWMMEASLPIIPKAITLVLDGGPSPGHMTDIFQVAVQRDAAWQIALDRATCSPDWSPERRFWKRRMSAYLFDGFPELLESMRKKDPDCRVRCNFYPGDPWTDDEIVEIAKANKDSDEFEWEHNMMRPGLTFTPPPPLPDFHSLKEDYVFEDSWTDRTWEPDISEQ